MRRFGACTCAVGIFTMAAVCKRMRCFAGQGSRTDFAPSGGSEDRTGNGSHNPDSLLDIAANVVAASVPFQRVEQLYPRIPEPVLSRIIYWSFPRNERDIRMYSTFMGPAGTRDEASDISGVPFDRGVRLLDLGAVSDVLQIGFHLSGAVKEQQTGLCTEPEKLYQVSVNFDRCKITSVKCGCDSRDIFWCPHVVALSLYRIRKADSVQIRMPISETLLQMTRDQLQKFSQYLISEHHSEVLPTAQRLADEILQVNSAINELQGAPDPTAGGSVDDDYSWHLDEDQVKKLVKNFLTHGSHTEQLSSIFDKVREMLQARDSNSVRMLTLISDQFMLDPRLANWRLTGIPNSDKCRPLWDEIAVLWVCVVLNPKCLQSDKADWVQKLKSWSEMQTCPLEDGETLPNPTDAGGGGTSNQTQPRTIFHRALEAVSLSWNDCHLQAILNSDGLSTASEQRRKVCRCTCHGSGSSRSTGCSHSKSSKKTGCPADWMAGYSLGQNNYNSPGPISCVPSGTYSYNLAGQYIWQESIPMACSRVEALRCHGYTQEARRLAVAVGRGLKHQQLQHHQSQTQCLSYHSKAKSSHSSSGGYSSHHRSSRPLISSNQEGWIGHPLDPIGCLFTTLLDASGVSSSDIGTPSSSDGAGVSSSDGASAKTFCHRSINGGKVYNNDSYLCLALEVALIGLGQQRPMLPGSYAQEKAVKQEEKLIGQLEQLELDNMLISVFKHQVVLLLESGSGSGLGRNVHADSVPMHSFAKYLFNSLLPYEQDLAFRVGLRAMRLPVLEDSDEPDEGGHKSVSTSMGPILGRYPRWFNIGHIETQQCNLAATMLHAARDDPIRLRMVLDSAQRNIYSSRQLFKLAQDAYKHSMPETGASRHRPLLDAALELGLQVMRMTLNRPGWHRSEMVRWLVKCATELGYEALISLMKNWYSLFTPSEATGTVATTIVSPTTLVHLGLDFVRQEELAQCACTLAVQCVRKDAPNCALGALTLCEKNARAFEEAYQHIVEAAPLTMNSMQLFAVARYMERRTNPMCAHKMALLAMKSLHLAHNQDTHPSINDIHWACALSHSLGKNELSSMIIVVVENVHCATVLSDVLRRCTLSAPGINAVDGKHRPLVLLSYDKPPLHQLLNAALSAYVNTTHSRLTHISPRHYADFIEFLSKARDAFLLAPDGHVQFAHLIENMKLVYKGKKKLMFLITERFGL